MEYFIPHEHTVGELTVEHVEVCLILCGSLDRREVWGRMGTGILMAEPLCSLPEITRILLLLFFFFLSFFLQINFLIFHRAQSSWSAGHVSS